MRRGVVLHSRQLEGGRVWLLLRLWLPTRVIFFHRRKGSMLVRIQINDTTCDLMVLLPQAFGRALQVFDVARIVAVDFHQMFCHMSRVGLRLGDCAKVGHW